MLMRADRLAGVFGSYSGEICVLSFGCNCSSLQYTAFYCLSFRGFFALILGCLVSCPDYAYHAFIVYNVIDTGIDSHQSVKFIKSDVRCSLQMCPVVVQQMA